MRETNENFRDICKPKRSVLLFASEYNIKKKHQMTAFKTAKPLDLKFP